MGGKTWSSPRISFFVVKDSLVAQTRSENLYLEKVGAAGLSIHPPIYSHEIIGTCYDEPYFFPKMFRQVPKYVPRQNRRAQVLYTCFSQALNRLNATDNVDHLIRSDMRHAASDCAVWFWHIPGRNRNQTTPFVLICCDFFRWFHHFLACWILHLIQ